MTLLRKSLATNSGNHKRAQKYFVGLRGQSIADFIIFVGSFETYDNLENTRHCLVFLRYNNIQLYKELYKNEKVSA